MVSALKRLNSLITFMRFGADDVLYLVDCTHSMNVPCLLVLLLSYFVTKLSTQSKFTISCDHYYVAKIENPCLTLAYRLLTMRVLVSTFAYSFAYSLLCSERVFSVRL